MAVAFVLERQVLIPADQLDRLQALGLLVSLPFVPGHVAFPDGVTVGKPATVVGNCVPGYNLLWGSDAIVVDAPTLKFYYKDLTWHVRCHEYIPGPGPGDFHNEFADVSEATESIADYFFGRPSGMGINYSSLVDNARAIDPADPAPMGTLAMPDKRVVDRLRRSVGALEFLIADGRIPQADVEQAQSVLGTIVAALDSFETVGAAGQRKQRGHNND